ncbi:hypothetical protein DL764_004481 [Monosporascus ibericus]|uniref:Uncharacterized protein n=1 Tax=Monosporascus ibericus TaxID=155417 RepID=A0A4Q4TG11_9PEZI|nr:hypothetical protein DL764_004481 [Monosporascus ibericus]
MSKRICQKAVNVHDTKAAPRRDRQPVTSSSSRPRRRQAQTAERVQSAAAGGVRQVAAELDVLSGRRGGRDEQPRGDGDVEGGAQRAPGVLGNITWWHNTEIGQYFYDIVITTNGSLGDEFRSNFGWDRRMAWGAVDEAHAHRLDDGKPVELDALLVPNDDVGGGNQACAFIPSYAGHPVASVPAG